MARPHMVSSATTSGESVNLCVCCLTSPVPPLQCTRAQRANKLDLERTRSYHSVTAPFRYNLPKIQRDKFARTNVCVQVTRLTQVVTPSGHIYSREAILEHLLTKTAELKRQREVWEADTRGAEREARANAEAREAAIRLELESTQSAIGRHQTQPRPAKLGRLEMGSDAPSTALVVAELSKAVVEPPSSLKAVDKPDASFWLPQFTPDAPKTRAPEPPKRPPSPVTANSLRVKDLASIDLRRADSSKATGIRHDGADVRFLCHVSNDEITTQTVLFIRNTGCVVIESVAQQLGVLQSKICPITSRKFKDKDVIRLASGASAYAAKGGDGLLIKKYRSGGGGA